MEKDLNLLFCRRTLDEMRAKLSEDWKSVKSVKYQEQKFDFTDVSLAKTEIRRFDNFVTPNTLKSYLERSPHQQPRSLERKRISILVFPKPLFTILRWDFPSRSLRLKWKKCLYLCAKTVLASWRNFHFSRKNILKISLRVVYELCYGVGFKIFSILWTFLCPDVICKRFPFWYICFYQRWKKAWERFFSEILFQRLEVSFVHKLHSAMKQRKLFS